MRTIVRKLIAVYFAICFGVLCYTMVIVKQLHEADAIQIQLEYQLDPMFNGLMDKVYTGQVWPYDFPYQGPDIETLRHVMNIENSLSATSWPSLN